MKSRSLGAVFLCPILSDVRSAPTVSDFIKIVPNRFFVFKHRAFRLIDSMLDKKRSICSFCLTAAPFSYKPRKRLRRSRVPPLSQTSHFLELVGRMRLYVDAFDLNSMPYIPKHKILIHRIKILRQAI